MIPTTQMLKDAKRALREARAARRYAQGTLEDLPRLRSVGYRHLVADADYAAAVEAATVKLATREAELTLARDHCKTVNLGWPC